MRREVCEEEKRVGVDEKEQSAAWKRNIGLVYEVS